MLVALSAPILICHLIVFSGVQCVSFIDQCRALWRVRRGPGLQQALGRCWLCVDHSAERGLKPFHFSQCSPGCSLCTAGRCGVWRGLVAPCALRAGVECGGAWLLLPLHAAVAAPLCSTGLRSAAEPVQILQWLCCRTAPPHCPPALHCRTMLG